MVGRIVVRNEARLSYHNSHVLQLRSFWYTMEVASRSNNDIGSGFVHVVWDKHSQLTDFDRRLWDGYLTGMTSAWPIKSMAIHSCCTPALVVKIIKPSKFQSEVAATYLTMNLCC